MYEEYYGFSERPFQLTPDPAFYYESVTHKKALSYLGYGLNQGEGFVVITGEVGSGKSTLVAHLKQKLDSDRMTVGEVVTSALDGEEMIHVAARSFGLDGRRALLIVDEAQNLSIGALEELRMLSNFQLGSHPLLQTLLLGQPEFKQLLAHSDELEQLRQRVIAAHHLEPMQPGEIEPYVEHRLRHVGWNEHPELDGSMWVKLHKATGGIPRKINQVMTRLLLLGSVEEKSRLDVEMLDTVVEEMSGDAAPAEDHVAKPRPDRDGRALEAIARARQEARQAEATAATGGAKDGKPATDAGTGADPQQTGLLDHQIQAIEAAFAERDKHLRAMREEVDKLAKAPAAGEASADTGERLSAIEARLDEQERSLRHVLAMMIDYFESQGSRAAA